MKLLLLGKEMESKNNALVAFHQLAQVLKPTANSDGAARSYRKGFACWSFPAAPLWDGRLKGLTFSGADIRIYLTSAYTRLSLAG